MLLGIGWSGPGSAQTPAGIGNPVPLQITSTTPTICEGSRAVLQASGGYLTGQTVSYSWSPNQNLSATTGAAVVVAPDQTMIYTVTSTSSSGSVASKSITVTVQASCCPRAVTPTADIVELAASNYNTSPFAGYAAGTRFHATGTLTLSGNVNYQLPTGGTLLLDQNADLIIREGATLTLPSAAITAACADMWGRLLVKGDAAGVRAYAISSLRPLLSHSYGGAEWEESVSASTAPFFRLSYMDFRHNRQRIQLNRTTVAAGLQDLIRDCTFDSDPTKFKVPWRYVSATDYYLSLRHIVVQGNVQPAGIYFNSFANAMFGVYCGLNNSIAYCQLEENQFDNIQLAGVYGNDQTGILNVIANTFRYPTATSLPPTPQLQAALGDTPGGALTYGIFSYNTPVAATYNTFEQADSTQYPTYDFGQYRPVQVGVWARQLQKAEDNTFRLLYTGVDDPHSTAPYASVQGNLFDRCRFGAVLHGGTPANFGLGLPAIPSRPIMSCNTFKRGRPTRTGNSTGILIPYDNGNTEVSFYDSNNNRRLLKNLFLDGGAGYGPSTFHAGVNLTNAFVPYKTFNLYYNIYRLSDYFVGIDVEDGIVNPDDTNNCASERFPYTGIQTRQAGNRQAVKPAGLSFQLSPNPASEQASIQLTGAQGKVWQGAIRVTRATDGKEVQHTPLANAAVPHTLSVHGWQAGVYVVTLYVEGAFVGSQRLLVY